MKLKLLTLAFVSAFALSALTSATASEPEECISVIAKSIYFYDEEADKRESDSMATLNGSFVTIVNTTTSTVYAGRNHRIDENLIIHDAIELHPSVFLWIDEDGFTSAINLSKLTWRRGNASFLEREYNDLEIVEIRCPE